MKKVKFYPLVIFLMISLSCQEKSKDQFVISLKDVFDHQMENITSLKILNKIVDFGELPEDTTVFASYKLVNIGESDLIINLVETDCQCTAYQLENKKILPGDTTTLTLEFNTKGKLGQNRVYAILHANTIEKLHKLVLINNVQ